MPILDALEGCRQGRDFSLQLDTTAVIIDRRSPNFSPSNPDAANNSPDTFLKLILVDLELGNPDWRRHKVA